MNTHDPNRLYEASIERLEAATMLAENKAEDVAVVYLAGLSIELILQAIAHRDNVAHDAGHDLDKWLGKCSPRFAQALKTSKISSSWSMIRTNWKNKIRYLPQSEWLNMCRNSQEWRMLKKGDNLAKMKQFNKILLESARTVHGKGLVVWQQLSN